MLKSATADDEKVWTAINAIDFEKMRTQGSGEGRTDEAWRDGTEAYKKFLFLCYKYPDEIFIPNEKIDHIWHKHILNIRMYMEDCKRILGRHIHHEPTSKDLSSHERQAMKDQYEANKRLYALHFDAPLQGKYEPFCYGGGWCYEYECYIS